jgi:hypothetical protein
VDFLDDTRRISGLETSRPHSEMPMPANLFFQKQTNGINISW